MHTDFVSVKPSIAYLPNSRPIPDCLYPPNGMPGSSGTWQFTHTVPASSRGIRFITALRSLLHRLAANPVCLCGEVDSNPLYARTRVVSARRAASLAARSSESARVDRYPALWRRAVTQGGCAALGQSRRRPCATTCAAPIKSWKCTTRARFSGCLVLACAATVH